MIFPVQNTALGDTRAAWLCELAAVLNMLHERTQTCMILRAAQNPRRQRETLCTDKSREKLHLLGAHQCRHKSPPLAQETDKRREGRAAMALHLFWKFPFSLNGILIPLFQWAPLALGGTTPALHRQSPQQNRVPRRFTGTLRWATESARGRREIAGIRSQFAKQN